MQSVASRYLRLACIPVRFTGQLPLLRGHLVPIREAPALRVVNAQLLLLAIVSALELPVFADRHWSDWSDWSDWSRGHWSAAEALRIPLALDVAREACRTCLPASAIAPLLNLAESAAAAAAGFGIVIFILMMLILMIIIVMLVVIIAMMILILVRGLGHARNSRLLIGDLDRSILI